MKLLKKLMKSILTLGLLGILVFPVNAMAVESSNIINILEPSENVIISEPMTFDEMAQLIAEDEGVSLEEAETILGGRNSTSNENVSSMSIQSTAYRTISRILPVTTTYKPQLRYYCQTSESGSFWGIVEILDIQMNRYSTVPGYTTVSKQFEGSVYSQLLNGYQIKFTVNGDFYHNGTTTGGGEVSIKVTEFFTINFSISNASSFYKYYYEEGVITTQS
jgi:hypothetical protein